MLFVDHFEWCLVSKHCIVMHAVFLVDRLMDWKFCINGIHLRCIIINHDRHVYVFLPLLIFIMTKCFSTCRSYTIILTLHCTYHGFHCSFISFEYVKPCKIICREKKAIAFILNLFTVCLNSILWWNIFLQDLSNAKIGMWWTVMSWMQNNLGSYKTNS